MQVKAIIKITMVITHVVLIIILSSCEVCNVVVLHFWEVVIAFFYPSCLFGFLDFSSTPSIYSNHLLLVTKEHRSLQKMLNYNVARNILLPCC